MGTTYLSASKLKGYRDCPKRHKEEPFRDSPATRFGHSVHAGLASMWRGGEFLPAYKAAAKKEGVPDSEEGRAIACFQAVRDHGRLEKISIDDVLVVESDDGEVEFYGNKYFQVEVVKGVWGLRGGMDLVVVLEDGSLLIIDWKTGRSEEVDDLQLACYALAAWLKYPGFSTIRVAFCYLEQGGKWHETEWNEQTLTGALEYIDKLAKDYINEKAWAPTTCKYCHYCSLKDKCPAYSQQLQAPVDVEEWKIPATKENFGKICDAIQKMEAIEKAAGGVLLKLEEARKEILQEGPVIHDGREFYLATGRASYDYSLAPIFEEAAAIIGRPPLEALSFSSTGYDGMVKDLSSIPNLPEDDKEAKKALQDARKLLKGIKDKHREKKPGKPTVKFRIAKEVTTEDYAPDAGKEDDQGGVTPHPHGQLATQGGAHIGIDPDDKVRTHFLCVQCGVVVRSAQEKLTEKCPGCHRPADETWTRCRDHKHAQQCQNNVVERNKKRAEIGADELKKQEAA